MLARPDLGSDNLKSYIHLYRVRRTELGSAGKEIEMLYTGGSGMSFHLPVEDRSTHLLIAIKL